MIRPAKACVTCIFLMLGGCTSFQDTTALGPPSSAAIDTGSNAPALNAYNHGSLEKAQDALESGDHLQAYKGFVAVLESDKSNVDALIGLGESMLAVGESAKALSVFAKVQQTSDQKAVALQGQGLALLAMGDNAKSESAFENALKENSKLWRSWNALGSIRDQSGLWQEARHNYDQALEINPNAISAMNNKGMSFLLERRFAEAEAEFRKVLQHSPETAYARTNLRLALAWQGKYAEALTGTRKEEMAVTLNNLGYIAAKRGEYDFAEAYLAQAMQMSPSYYAKAAENLEYVKQLRNAKKATTTNLSLDKQNPK